ncbi:MULTISPECIES: hypothetical protein [Curtobacterium]|uniref:hypothetical protein n=1 Tax=Curtobacterium flaccumfaciens TaxID=2035 RepID=UPI003EE4BACA
MVAGAAVNGFDRGSIIALAGTFVGVATAITNVERTAAFVSVDAEVVVLGLAPFWRTQIRAESVSGVELINVDAIAAWAGNGIKGRLHSGPGRLYSVGGSCGVAITTEDGQRVTVAFRESLTAQRVVEAIDEVRRSSFE